MPPQVSDKKRVKIRVLPEELANQIAAGEVVERPASVVKELIENSIDAGATRILVEIESGGKKLIKVTDNGIGMASEDAKAAFARHATSKITRPEDLEAIHTLGFRGEALPSIASIARVRLTTSADENKGGVLVTVEGGTMGPVRDIACPRGTTIEVAQIFYNTPARKKFLKGDSTEFSHIAQVVTQQALANPHIHFNLTHNGRETINTLPTEELLYRIAELFGADLAKELVRVDGVIGDYKVQGFVSSPIYTRSSRSAQYCFINRRFVRDKVILHATQQGYSHLLPKGQHPVIFLELSMDSRLLDVNVHPSKAEVRFAFQQEVHRLVSEEIRKALSRNEKIPMEPVVQEQAHDYFKPGRGSSFSQSTFSSSSQRSFSDAMKPGDHSAAYQSDLSEAFKMMVQPHSSLPASSGAHSRQQPVYFDHKPTPVSSLIYSDFEPLGQMANSFIILQGKKGMVVVDQHVAHERILYERFRNAARNKKIEVQQLLFPVAVEFSPGEAELLGAQTGRLGELGMEIEPFGPTEFLIRSVPAILKNNDPAEILREIVSMLPGNEDPTVLQEKFEDILIMMSCRNAMKINHPLDRDQINKLIADLEETEMPYTCPHGRPIALYFDMEDILKKFLRK